MKRSGLLLLVLCFGCAAEPQAVPASAPAPRPSSESEREEAISEEEARRALLALVRARPDADYERTAPLLEAGERKVDGDGVYLGGGWRCVLPARRFEILFVDEARGYFHSIEGRFVRDGAGWRAEIVGERQT